MLPYSISNIFRIPYIFADLITRLVKKINRNYAALAITVLIKISPFQEKQTHISTLETKTALSRLIKTGALQNTDCRMQSQLVISLGKGFDSCWF